MKALVKLRTAGCRAVLCLLDCNLVDLGTSTTFSTAVLDNFVSFRPLPRRTSEIAETPEDR